MSNDRPKIVIIIMTFLLAWAITTVWLGISYESMKEELKQCRECVTRWRKLNATWYEDGEKRTFSTFFKISGDQCKKDAIVEIITITESDTGPFSPAVVEYSGE